MSSGSLGLVSVTFRALTPAQVIGAAVAAGLSGIEWGGDIHVPHGDLAAAREVRRRTQDAGLDVVSYGSYYKAGQKPDPQVGPTFEAVLETAVSLGAPNVRVWAGTSGSADCSPSERRAVVEDLAHITGLARSAGIGVSLEFHGGTLTDTAESATSLMREAGQDAPSLYWQPVVSRTTEENLADLRAVAPFLSNLHMFHWNGMERRPFEEGASEWTRYLECAGRSGFAGWLLFEFVRDDSPEQLVRDAQALKRIL